MKTLLLTIRTAIEKKPLIVLITAATLLTAGILWFSFQQAEPPSNHPAVIAAPIPAIKTVSLQTVSPDDEAGKSVSAAADANIHPQVWTRPLTIPKPATRRAALTSNQAALPLINRTEWLNAAYRALSAGQSDQAETRYLAILDRYPHEKDALLGLAVIAHRRGLTQQASRYYRQVLTEDMGNATAAAGLIGLSSQRDPIAAASRLDELLYTRPNSAELHYASGRLSARQQQWGEAQLAFANAYALQPSNAVYAYQLAVSLDHLHQFADALAYYRTATELANSAEFDRERIAQRIQQLRTALAHQGS